MKVVSVAPEGSLAYLSIHMPSRNEKREDTMAKCLEAMHHVLSHNDLLSFELAVKNQTLSFYIVTSSMSKTAVQSQLHAYFPEIEIESVSDYLPSLRSGAFGQMRYKYASSYPLKTYKDSNEGILKSLSGIISKIHQNDEFYLQCAFLKVGSHFSQQGVRTTYQKYFKQDQEIKEKLSHNLFRGLIRVAYLSDDVPNAKKTLETICGTFKHVNGRNELQFSPVTQASSFWLKLQNRIVQTSDVWNPHEIATLYHFPYSGSGISSSQTNTKVAPAPDMLPLQKEENQNEVSFFGETTYRNENKVFGIKRVDRRRHMYVVGKTGSGKSRLLQLLLLSDIRGGEGCCLIDPHGDLAEELLSYIPKNRMQDVVYVNPTDKDFPIGFNPLAATESYEERQQLCTFFIAIFKKLFAENWNSRIEHLLRFIILALLETPDATMLGISRMLTDTAYRQRVIKHISDPVVKSFWTTEFSASNEQFISIAAVPLMNKLGQFISHPVIRNMVGQRENTLDFEKFMNERKIVIINLAKGKIGEENSSLLGAMCITKIYQAALSRANISEEKRQDFYCYIDEFQNFATEAFASILSEARKYRLNMTIAHQYMAQLSEEIRAAVFGNVATLVSFAVGGNDASYLEKEFAPVFTSENIRGLHAREMYIKMSIDGKTSPPFSARTITVTQPESNYSQEIIHKSRLTYGKNRIAVENEIRKWSDSAEMVEKKEDQPFPEPII